MTRKEEIATCKAANVVEEKRIWMRLGIYIKADEDTINKLLTADDNSVLEKLIKDGKFELADESYIPSVVIEDYNNENGTDFEEDEVSYYF